MTYIGTFCPTCGLTDKISTDVSRWRKTTTEYVQTVTVRCAKCGRKEVTTYRLPVPDHLRK